MTTFCNTAFYINRDILMAVLTLQAFTVLLHLVWWICTKILEGASNLKYGAANKDIRFLHNVGAYLPR
jgi:hypothetical protein